MMLAFSSKIIVFAFLAYGTIANIINCSGNTNKCQNTTINCIANENCIISCNGDSSCRYSTISGPINGNLTVHCNGEQSCFGVIFNGWDSSQLNITGCTEYESCLHLSLYCPSTPKLFNKNCIIQGNNNLAGDITIYAIYGWNAIDIDYTGTADITHNGQMFCGYNYNISCSIAPDHWSCLNINDYCNNIDIGSSSNISTILIPTTDTNSSIDDVLFTVPDTNDGTKEMIIVVVFIVIMGISWIICGVIRHHLKQHVDRKLSVISNEDIQFDESSDSQIIEEIEQMTLDRTSTVTATNYAM